MFLITLIAGSLIGCNGRIYAAYQDKNYMLSYYVITNCQKTNYENVLIHVAGTDIKLIEDNKVLDF